MGVPNFFKVEEPRPLPHVSKKTKKTKMSNSIHVDVVIPVYKGYEQTKRCIDSVLTSNYNETTTQIIVINDCSPDLEIERYLNSLAKNKKIILLKNQINMGFVTTVNYGMQLFKAHDVVLLNSDTQVYGDWLNKLKWHAYCKRKIGTVTPFSNNATICSYPNLLGFHELPDGHSTDDFDKAFFKANKHKNITLPTAVGFCMYIRRKCLNDIGLFDEEKFGKGYGEENDFCLRATKRNWIHLLAGDTFVYHEGSVSFSEESESRKKNALKNLTHLYPEYEQLISEHIKKNEIYPLINSAMIQRVNQEKKPKILHVLHNLGGGTEKHVKELTDQMSNKAIHLIMMPLIDGNGLKKFHIFSTCKFEKINITIEMNKLSRLVSFLKKLGISLIHFHHLLNYPLRNIKGILKAIDKPYYITVHDYMFICPQITLINKNNNLYCGELGVKQCKSCIETSNPLGAKNIISWRNSYKNFLEKAQKIICPSIDVADRMKKYFPKSKYIVAYHETLPSVEFKIKLTPISKDECLRIAIIGIMAPHKGSELITELCKVIDKSKEKIEFKLIGFVVESPATKTLKTNKCFSCTGEYDDSKLINKISEYNPHVIFFTSRCPETYSYTLSSAIRSKLPILAPNIGAFPERLHSRSWTWLYKLDSDAREVLSQLKNIRNQILERRASTPNTLPNKSFISSSYNFYSDSYLNFSR